MNYIPKHRKPQRRMPEVTVVNPVMGDRFELYLDGEAFPFHVTDFSVDRFWDDFSAITVTIPYEKLEVLYV